MENIQIKFRLNKELDKKMCLDFFDVKEGGIDFGQTIIETHPKLKLVKEIINNEEKKKQISEYFDWYYNTRIKDLEEKVVIAENGWRDVQDSFFAEVRKIFLEHEWPDGEYMAFMSIIKCNVLFFENKCWQIFYGVPQDYNKIIAHELLHFIFIDYFNKYIVEQKLKDNCWMISEVFNDVILNTSEFKEIIKSAEELGYYDHEEIFKRMFREWNKTKNIKKWLTKFKELM